MSSKLKVPSSDVRLSSSEAEVLSFEPGVLGFKPGVLNFGNSGWSSRLPKMLVFDLTQLGSRYAYLYETQARQYR